MLITTTKPKGTQVSSAPEGAAIGQASYTIEDRNPSLALSWQMTMQCMCVEEDLGLYCGPQTLLLLIQGEESIGSGHR